MANNSLTRRVLIWAIVPVLALGIAGMWFPKLPGLHLRSAAFADEMSQEQFERRVRDYLLAHPEIIGEVINRPAAKQVELDAAKARVALQAHDAEVFHDPDSPIGGNPSGNVTLVEFFDYNCPYCKMMAPLITQAETADPWLRIVYKEFPILGPGSVFAAKAALAANKQGKYTAFHRALYQARGHVDETKVLEVAAAVGLDVARMQADMQADMQDKAMESILERNIKLGQLLHITGTPGFVVGDQITTGAMDFDALQSLIGEARSANQATK